VNYFFNVDKLMKNRAGFAINKFCRMRFYLLAQMRSKWVECVFFEIRGAESTFGVCYNCLTPFQEVEREEVIQIL